MIIFLIWIYIYIRIQSICNLYDQPTNFAETSNNK